MPCPSQTSGFNVPNYVRLVPACSELTTPAVEYVIRKVQEYREGLELTELYQLLVYVDDVNMLREDPQSIRKNMGILLEASKEIEHSASGVAQSIKVLAFRSEVAQGRGCAHKVTFPLVLQLANHMLREATAVRDRVTSWHGTCASGTFRVALLKMDIPIPAPAECEVRSVIKFLNAQGIAPIEIDRKLCQVYGQALGALQL
ncbi:hypothetical protein ANN_13358 [Periplaneta americana]|uniref:Uncharacterized protein n=1 Tax=Periplaneta americana TaxID=6978 RepID=A0ABQ8TKL8_PERAM|nr:hypothetical protein ANN_13358 [Periplaneta americana]